MTISTNRVRYIRPRIAIWVGKTIKISWSRQIKSVRKILIMIKKAFIKQKPQLGM